ncbi:adenylate synthase [Xylophilus sp. Kf1]|nr:adenylate synthase [Xylophilus sp. Kf1]
MPPSESLVLLSAFARTRWGYRFADRDRLEAWQHRRLARFLARQLPRAPFYRDHPGAALAALPIVDKATLLARFADLNTHGVTLAQATAVALAAEASRDFTPLLGSGGGDTGLTVGLSSGTQGARGVFLASARERALWAGILLARTLDGALLHDLVRRPAPLRVAFFLRADSRLYATLASRRLDLRFFDLHAGVEAQLPALRAFAPDVLVAPASVLAWIADHAGALPPPRKVISVAEVLEPDDERRIASAFGLPVHQLYQCTEGFLGYTCEHGALHLNEEFVHVEPEWLDDARTRFQPIVTDFTRSAQLFVRHRLTDVLTVLPGACACGRHTRRLAGITGRMDDVLWLPHRDGSRLVALFPDIVRHAIVRQSQTHPDYRLSQRGETFELAVEGGETAAFQAIAAAVDQTVLRLGMAAPRWRQVPLPAASAMAKRRRIACLLKPAEPGRTGGVALHA